VPAVLRFPPQVFTGYQAARGWDPVTGLGSPDAQVLVPLLARNESRADVNRSGEFG
jgi:hypothetical protein